ncbi:olfactory receptor 11L1-like [Hyperolius riggenbachi]|uniref:olfactory receptor 11L1-like n=1 Tax=Hyperolius riggenbachi TaxID=752182 RepID=UPI0035A2667D
MEFGNFSQVTEVFLLGFHSVQSLKILFFFLVLTIYCVTICGNLSIILLVSFSRDLQCPMYFFLAQLSFSDILLTSNITPNMLHVILHEGSNMTLAGCLTQFYFFTASEALECLLLTVMSYDRYQAICNPLHYTTLIDQTFCINTVLSFWFFILAIILMLSLTISRLQFCGPHVIDHFFCDFAPLLGLSCSDTFVVELESKLLAIPLVIAPFVIITVSYVYIISNILKISSVTTGRQKTFSTCSSHLVAVSLYYGSLISIYLFPNQELVKKIISVFYTAITPLLNPIIYSLRNRDIKQALLKILNKSCFPLQIAKHNCNCMSENPCLF